MDVIQPTFKLPLSTFDVSDPELVTEWHRWVSEQELDDLLFDVADYKHVHKGPGILLIAHEAYYGIDEQGGVQGLLYRGRRGEPADAAAMLNQAATKAIAAANLLKKAFGDHIVFAPESIEVGFDDRLRAPATAETFATLAPTLETFATRLFGEGAKPKQVDDPKRCFRVQFDLPLSVTFQALQERLA